MLFIDELDKGWDSGTAIPYNRDFNVEVPFAVDRLTNHPTESNTANVTDYPVNYFNKYTVNGKRIVSKMPLRVFQERLIHNFDIRFKNNDIQWPKRTTSNHNNIN